MIKKRICEARQDSGLTLVEPLIVLVALGLVAIMVVFGMGTVRNDSKAAACSAEKKNISVAAEAYIAEQGTTPSLADLVLGEYLKAHPTSVQGGTVVIRPDGKVTGICVA